MPDTPIFPDLEASMSQLEAALFTNLEKRVGKSVTDLARLYVPALRRMGLADLMSFMDLSLNGKDYDAARKIAQSAMTPEELTTEKEKLTTLLAMMADTNAQRVQMAKQMYGAGFVLAIRSLIGLALGSL